MDDANNNDQLLESSATHQLLLEELPHSLLTEISSYLGAKGAGRRARSTGSDILLAVALAAPQSSWEKCQYTDNTQKLLSPASKGKSIHSPPYIKGCIWIRTTKIVYSLVHVLISAMCIYICFIYFIYQNTNF